MRKNALTLVLAGSLIAGNVCAQQPAPTTPPPSGTPAPVDAAALKTMLEAPELQKRLFEAKQGSVVMLDGVNVENAPRIPYQKTILPGPQYLISDDPEYIRVPEGVALREDLQPGTVRIYVYNVNGVKEPAKIPRKITAVIENLGGAELHMRMLRRAFPEPSGNYFLIGKTALRDFMMAKPESETRAIPVGGAVPIDPKMEATVVNYDDLVHGFYEFVIDQPARIHVLQMAPEDNGPDAARRMKDVLPTKSKSGAGRGLFGVSNYWVTRADDSVIDTTNGPCQIVVADGKDDPWVTGTEHTIAEPAVLKGNYGVMYDIELKRTSSDGRALALVTWNARYGPGNWCGGMAASMIVSEGYFEAGPVMVPTEKLTTKAAPEYVVLQVFPPLPKGETDTIHIKYSPPGASCLPTPLVFIPVAVK